MTADPFSQYWIEAVSSALDEHGIEASDKAIVGMAKDIEISHENYGMAFPAPSGPSQLQRDIDDANRMLDEERRKVHCRSCGGAGRIITQGPYHGTDSECWKCRGEGRHLP